MKHIPIEQLINQKGNIKQIINAEFDFIEVLYLLVFEN